MPRWYRQLRAATRLRVRRHYLLGRALRRSRRQLTAVCNRTTQIGKGAVLVFVTLRNERVRLPYFLEYYRKMGVDHFLCVDNGSTDGSGDWLARQPDVSLWHTKASYKGSRFGMDWINGLLFRYGSGHWCLTVDPDEFLVYPHCDTRPLKALTDWLDSSAIRSFSAMLIDVYPRGPIDEETYEEGQNPFEVARWFDPASYSIKKNGEYGNLWIQGGPRGRTFFGDDPWKGPALNKIPLVRWERSYVYVSSTHMLLPRSLNLVYDEDGGEKASGCLLHAKFLSTFAEKAREELLRKQHYAESHEYKAYHAGLRDSPVLWTEESREVGDWRVFEDVGLISKGNWA